MYEGKLAVQHYMYFIITQAQLIKRRKKLDPLFSAQHPVNTLTTKISV